MQFKTIKIQYSHKKTPIIILYIIELHATKFSLFLNGRQWPLYLKLYTPMWNAFKIPIVVLVLLDTNKYV